MSLTNQHNRPLKRRRRARKSSTAVNFYTNYPPIFNRKPTRRSLLNNTQQIHRKLSITHKAWRQRKKSLKKTQRHQASKKMVKFANDRKHWTESDDIQLQNWMKKNEEYDYKNKAKMKVLSVRFKRTEWAIQCRITKHQKSNKTPKKKDANPTVVQHHYHHHHHHYHHSHTNVNVKEQQTKYHYLDDSDEDE